MPKTIVGVMGPGEKATKADCQLAFDLGRLIASNDWLLLTGGRAHGVMHAASEGAKSAGGLTVGVSPFNDQRDLSPAVDIPILTGLGEARNYVNVVSSQVIFVCGMNSGTASEVALALKAQRPVILLKPSELALSFFRSLESSVIAAADPKEAVRIAKDLLEKEP